ncbi:TetR/AcrR family transcriptional regulator [Ktedonosporobacter rubrisoli]|uniref:TetR/AcrR family transcriptional regulator n=1 Tax=Ktedonosporobacter rubrisoli TaxID=2509675 RepID=A0A4P6JSG3_KTERU|nr:TetR/AcrR family transcriptional regulator [Ktedonosporobacter rubrisoli]QBD78170.1 TetR/AcrR family transcriptional regulator [Ktedonosporobacter rubrisoli]
MKMNPTRQHILETANRIVQQQGATQLTIEAVARAAGLSKGGVLYHFPSKDALIEAMINFHIDNFTHEFNNLVEQETPGAGRQLRAYIRSSRHEDQEANAAFTGLVAAIANNPDLIETLRQHYQSWQELAEQDGLPPALGTILRLAVDGLWFADLLGLAPPEGKLREEVIETLLRLARPQQDKA